MNIRWPLWFTFLCLAIVSITAWGQERSQTEGGEEPVANMPLTERYRGPLPLPPRVENLKSTQRSNAVPPLGIANSVGSGNQGSVGIPSGGPNTGDRSLPAPSTLGRAVTDAQKLNAGANLATQSIGSPDIDRVDVKLEVSGKVGDPKVGTSSLKLEANLLYEEQIIQRGDAYSQPIQAIRLYQNAEAKIWFNDALVQPTLREDRRYIGVSCADGKCELFCPNGPLTRDELDLLDVLASSSVVDLLLSKEPIRQGTEWDVPDYVLSSFLGLDSVTANTVKCRASEILPGGVARVEISGNLRGVILGATTQAELLGRLQVGLAQRKVTWLGMVMKEKREAGLVDHPFEVTSRLQLMRTPASDPQLVKERPGHPVTFPPLPEHLRLIHQDETNGWQVTYDRKWYLVSSSPEVTVFRMVDRQGQVAQCNIASLPAQEAKMTLAGLRENVQHILGQNFGRILDANELKSPTGHQMFHVHVTGQVSDVPIHWIYYVMTAPDGRSYAAAFTIEEKTLERFGNGDRELVDGFEFLQRTDVQKISQKQDSEVR